jgi:hypothetical protein
MPTIDKLYPDTKPAKSPYTSGWVQWKIDEFLNKGGQIKEIPRGVHAQEAQPLSVVRRNIEKSKNFGDDIRT